MPVYRMYCLSMSWDPSYNLQFFIINACCGYVVYGKFNINIVHKLLKY